MSNPIDFIELPDPPFKDDDTDDSSNWKASSAIDPPSMSVRDLNKQFVIDAMLQNRLRERVLALHGSVDRIRLEKCLDRLEKVKKELRRRQRKLVVGFFLSVALGLTLYYTLAF